MKEVTRCRICDSNKLFRFLDLGNSPLADDFVNKNNIDLEEKKYPLIVGVCEECNLVMLMHSINKSLLFGESYAFYTSCSPQAVLHFRDCAKNIESKYSKFKDKLLVEIASNDGVLLRPLIELGFKNVLGIEPAMNVAAMAKASGINTINKFFNSVTANEVVRNYEKAGIIVANNVVAHVDDLSDFMKGIDNLLDDNGIFIFEVQYFPNILFKNQFDNIYHEHHSFFSIKPIVKLLNKNKFKLIDIQQIETQGGSLRLYAIKDKNHDEKISPNVNKLTKLEESYKLSDLNTYKNYSQKIYKLRDELVNILRNLKKENKRIVGYGAPAKGNTLLNFCKIGPDLLDYIIDKTYFKHGKYTPGMHIPVFPTEKILEDGPPDYYLLLVWNYADGILKAEHNYILEGGKFIIPIPNPVIV